MTPIRSKSRPAAPAEPGRAVACLPGIALSVMMAVTPLVTQAAEAATQSLGAGLRWQAAVEGSDRGRTDLVPLADLDRGPWFLRTTRGVAEAGARLSIGEGLRVGGQVAFEPGRDAKAVPALAQRGVADLSAGASVGVFAEAVGRLGPAPASAVVRIRSHLDSDRGSQADLRVTVGLAQSGALVLGGFVQGTWADAAAMDTSFGVSPALAARSGWTTYRAGGGWRQVSAGLLGQWDLAPGWALQGSLEARTLLGSARSSPLVQQPAAAAAVLGVARTW